jgi:hypothetical protein
MYVQPLVTETGFRVGRGKQPAIEAKLCDDYKIKDFSGSSLDMGNL